MGGDFRQEVVGRSSDLVAGRKLDLPDADVTFYSQLYGPEDSDRLQFELNETVAWYGDPHRSYSYSGITMESEPWTEPLLEIKARIEEVSATTFNSVLINLYRDGRDGVGWHSDDEPELGEHPVIGSVSFGGVRNFVLRHKRKKHEGHRLRVELHLTHGSYLLMRGETQRFWMHQIPKTEEHVGPRINLTFRQIG